MKALNSLPTWLRWVILLPASIGSGLVAGYGVYLLNASQAARPDAPIVYLADFAGSIVSNLVCFYVAYEIAPAYKSRIVATLIAITVLASAGTIYFVLQHGRFAEFIGIAGNVVGCIIGWRKFVSGPWRANPSLT